MSSSLFRNAPSIDSVRTRSCEGVWWKAFDSDIVVRILTSPDPQVQDIKFDSVAVVLLIIATKLERSRNPTVLMREGRRLRRTHKYQISHLVELLSFS